MLITLGQQYQHYRNGNVYRLMDFCKVQINGVWQEAVLYVCEDGHRYVRTVANFRACFSPVDRMA